MWTSQGLNLGPPDYESVKRYKRYVIRCYFCSIYLADYQ